MRNINQKDNTVKLRDEAPVAPLARIGLKGMHARESADPRLAGPDFGILVRLARDKDASRSSPAAITALLPTFLPL